MEWTWRKEFRWKSFTLHHDEPYDFSLSRWQTRGRVHGWFVFYRALLSAFTFAILLASFFVFGWGFWFIYLTDLGFLGQTLHLTVSTAATVARLFQERDGTTNGLAVVRMTVLDYLSWVFYNLTTTISIIITIVYWTALYTPGSGLNAMDFMVHGVNTIVTVMDLFASARPWRLMHFYQPMAAMLGYIVFSVIYWAAGGVNVDGCNYIYSILDWNNPSFTVPFVIVGLVLILPLHAFLWSLHLLRDWIFNRLSARKIQGSPSLAYDNPVLSKVEP